MDTPVIDWTAAEAEMVTILRDLIRFDTSNPPGNELPAAAYLADRLRADGLEPQIFRSAPNRGNVVARLKGTGGAPPLLLSAHLDVVPARAEQWDHPPFDGDLIDGFVWGRGAADMKYVAAQYLVALLLLRRHEIKLSRDIIFAAVADEEQGGEHGSGFLVDQHPESIQSEYALTEGGGIAMPMGNQTVVLVGTGTKGVEWFRARARGQFGHGSKASPDSAIHRLLNGLQRLGDNRLDHHLCASTSAFLDGLGVAQGGAAKLIMRLLKSPATASLALRAIPGEKRSAIEAALFNTAVATGLAAGDHRVPNMLEEQADAIIDGRVLPGYDRGAFLNALQQKLGPEVTLESFRSLPPLEVPLTSSVMDAVQSAVAKTHPRAHVVPFLAFGFTDGNLYARAGIKTYGFAPIVLKEGEPFSDLLHSPNERVSVAGIGAGLKWLFDVVCQIGGAT